MYFEAWAPFMVGLNLVENAGNEAMDQAETSLKMLAGPKSQARPTDASVYASNDTSRCRPQDSRSGWIRYFLSCRALASPTTCRFIPAALRLARHATRVRSVEERRRSLRLSRYSAPAMRAVFWVEFTFPSLINPVGFRSRTRLGRQNASYPTAKSWIVGNSEAIQTCL